MKVKHWNFTVWSTPTLHGKSTLVARRVVILLQHVKCFPLGAFIRFVNIAAVDSHPILSDERASISSSEVTG